MAKCAEHAEEHCQSYPRCYGCNAFRDPTVADRILNMKYEEELAEFLVEVGWDCHNCSEHYRLDNEPLLRCEKCDEKCVDHCIEWLKKPAKEYNNG